MRKKKQVDPDVHVLGHEVRIPRYGAAPMHKIARYETRNSGPSNNPLVSITPEC